MNRSHDNRLALCESKEMYKMIIGKKKREYTYKKSRGLMSLKRNQPKYFWRHFKQQKSY